MSKETSTDKSVKKSQDVQELELSSKGKSTSGMQKTKLICSYSPNKHHHLRDLISTYITMQRELKIRLVYHLELHLQELEALVKKLIRTRREEWFFRSNPIQSLLTKFDMQ